MQCCWEGEVFGTTLRRVGLGTWIWLKVLSSGAPLEREEGILKWGRKNSTDLATVYRWARTSCKWSMYKSYTKCFKLGSPWICGKLKELFVNVTKFSEWFLVKLLMCFTFFIPCKSVKKRQGHAENCIGKCVSIKWTWLICYCMLEDIRRPII